MKNIIKFSSFCLIITMATSCTYIYYPTHPVIPDTKEKGAGVQISAGLTKAQLAGWYAMDSSLYITGTFGGAVSLSGDSDSTTGSNPYHALSANIGAGYVFPLSSNIEFNLQGGAGFGKGYFRTAAFNKDLSGSSIGITALDVSTSSIRGYIQPAFGFNNPKSSVFIIPRVTYEAFNSVKPKSKDMFSGDHDLTPRSFLITELFMMTRFKTKVVNIELYAGIAANLTQITNNSAQSEVLYVAQPVIFGLGFSKTFGIQ